MSMPLLPHAPPMHWLDSAALECDGISATASRLITLGHPFVVDGCLLPTALMELMAQCAAAGTALAAQGRGLKIRSGVLAALREFRIFSPVPVDSTVLLNARQEKSLGSLTRAHLTAHIGSALVAQATMTFHLQFE